MLGLIPIKSGLSEPVVLMWGWSAAVGGGSFWNYAWKIGRHSPEVTS
jgi:hypothetical protein